MRSLELFREIVAAQKKGIAAGVCSICSAHPAVMDAAFLAASRESRAGQSRAGRVGPVLIESTVNQVNQLGGYTGMTPADFRAFLESRAEQSGFPKESLILGGDHLGPYPWRSKPAGTAMALARELVAACVRAGYAKIHLDASMPLAGDRTDAAGALDPVVAAQREAELAQAAEAAFREHEKTHPDASPPVYVIGTEVPAPGGITAGENGVEVTRTEVFQDTVLLCEEAFSDRGLSGAWERVVACVAQPGVEYGDKSIHRYDRGKAEALCRTARAASGIVIEGHSTDYQSRVCLRQLVEDGVAILKVGPALTFAMRECLFSLERIEQELIAGRGGVRPSALMETLDRAMMENTVYWKDYYTGSDAEKRLSRKYSFSDRCRYYWTAPAVRESLAALMGNLRGTDIPLPLVSQYVPRIYPRVVEGLCAADPQSLVRESICMVLEDYAAATAV